MGNSYIPLPFRSNNLINIKNNDNISFKYCIIAHFLTKLKLIKDHVERVNNYHKAGSGNLFHFNEFLYPMKLKEIKRF